VLCGCAIGPYSGRSQIIILKGQIDNFEITKEYTIHSTLYEIVETNMKIDVPYRNAAEYDIWMTDEQPIDPRTIAVFLTNIVCVCKDFRGFTLTIVALRSI
jgi:hypothetical protein